MVHFDFYLNEKGGRMYVLAKYTVGIKQKQLNKDTSKNIIILDKTKQITSSITLVLPVYACTIFLVQLVGLYFVFLDSTCGDTVCDVLCDDVHVAEK